MNPTCPRTNRLCFDCTEPCKALALNDVTIPEPEKPFLGILAPIAQTLGVETDPKKNKYKLTVTIPL